ncbi:hypothetical protein KHA80_19625 [Anaerobacillus sp. HL2]|nr:hypothetical protein KHA80_19625 [Anaerobacillus sp. HL2]
MIFMIISLQQRSSASTWNYIFFDDWSLGEIAEEYELVVGRLLIIFKRTEDTMLEEYERKLKLVAKFERAYITLYKNLKWR